ncbi:MAG: tetratricopeptide repeat protein, partial [Candidatus Ranarchaeia archaeon]
AEEILGSLWKTEQDNSDVWLLRAYVSARLGNKEMLGRMIRLIGKYRPKDLFFLLCPKIQDETKQLISLVTQEFQKDWRRSPCEMDLLLSQAEFFAGKGNWRKALLILNTMVRLHPQSSIPYLAMAKLWLRMGNYHAVQQFYENAQRKNPKSIENLYLYLEFKNRLADDNALAQGLRSVPSELQDDPFFSILLGDFECSWGDFRNAKEFYASEKIIYNGLSPALITLNRLSGKRILKVSKTALFGTSNIVVAHQIRGICDLAASKGHFKKAITLLNIAKDLLEGTIDKWRVAQNQAWIALAKKDTKRVDRILDEIDSVTMNLPEFILLTATKEYLEGHYLSAMAALDIISRPIRVYPPGPFILARLLRRHLQTLKNLGKDLLYQLQVLKKISLFLYENRQQKNNVSLLANQEYVVFDRLYDTQFAVEATGAFLDVLKLNHVNLEKHKRILTGLVKTANYTLLQLGELHDYILELRLMPKIRQLVPVSDILNNALDYGGHKIPLSELNKLRREPGYFYSCMKCERDYVYDDLFVNEPPYESSDIDKIKLPYLEEPTNGKENQPPT